MAGSSIFQFTFITSSFNKTFENSSECALTPLLRGRTEQLNEFLPIFTLKCLFINVRLEYPDMHCILTQLGQSFQFVSGKSPPYIDLHVKKDSIAILSVEENVRRKFHPNIHHFCL